MAVRRDPRSLAHSCYIPLAQHQTRTSFGSIRFAYVLKEPVLDPKKFGETVAVNRGMLIRVFDNPEEALQWLEIPSADNPDDR